MKKVDKQNDQKGKFSFGDVIIILLSLVAIAGLLLIMKTSREQERMKQEELNNIGEEIEEEISTEVSDILSYIAVNEVNPAGWIELYNTGKEDVELNGLKVSVNNVVEYTVAESVILEQGDFYVCEMDCKLAEKDIIAVQDAQDIFVAHMSLPALYTGESYGAKVDGGIEYAYISETKDTSNAEATLSEKQKLLFSVEGGFYEESFELVLNAPEGYTIYYTLDGTEPTTASKVYEKPIGIANRSGSNFKYAKKEVNTYFEPESLHMGTVVRAIVADKSGKVVEEHTESYFIGLESISEYGNMPVISLTTNPENLFDYFEGIYVPGRSYEDAVAKGEDTEGVGNYHNGWVKDAYLEYFESDKGKTYEGKVKININHDYSSTSAQKSFYVTGNAALSGSGLSNYLNASSGELLIQTAQRDNDYKIRELVAARLVNGAEAGMPALEPCILFINGEYWGGYILRETYDQEYFNENYSIGEETVITVKNGLINNYEYNGLYEEFYEYVIHNDMSEEQHYERVKEMMDVQSFLDYFCANMYLANADYGSEVTIWRTVSEGGSGYADGKWRWLFGHMDLTMDNGMVGNVATATIDTLLQSGVTGDPFLQSLLMNEEFCKQLSDTMSRMAAENFDIAYTESIIDETADSIEKYALSSYKRFNQFYENDFYDDEVEKIKNFFENRSDYILLYTEEFVKQGGNADVISEGRSAVKGETHGEEGKQADEQEDTNDGVSQ